MRVVMSQRMLHALVQSRQHPKSFSCGMYSIFLTEVASLIRMENDDVSQDSGMKNILRTSSCDKYELFNCIS